MDTIRWRLDLRPLFLARYGRAIETDLARLTPDRGWHRLAIPAETRQHEVARFLRSRDGARIILYESSIHAEVSAPRHAGFSNDEHHRLSPWAVLGLLRELEWALLPRTTRACRHPRVMQEWHLVRLDLAIDFPADIGAIIETYRDARHPRIRARPEVYGRHGIAWLGKAYQLVIYRTDKRPRRSKFRKHVDPTRMGTGKPGVVRAEFRFRTREAIRALVKSLSEMERVPIRGGTQCLRFDRGGVSERSAVSWTPFTNSGLHRVLARELESLEGVARPELPLRSKNVVHGLGLVLIALVPQCWSTIESNYSERQARSIEKQVTGLRVRALRTSLVELAWPWRGLEVTPRLDMMSNRP